VLTKELSKGCGIDATEDLKLVNKRFNDIVTKASDDLINDYYLLLDWYRLFVESRKKNSQASRPTRSRQCYLLSKFDPLTRLEGIDIRQELCIVLQEYVSLYNEKVMPFEVIAAIDDFLGITASLYRKELTRQDTVRIENLIPVIRSVNTLRKQGI